MSPAIRCELCGVAFGVFGDAERAAQAFQSHSCMAERARRNHPSMQGPVGGAA